MIITNCLTAIGALGCALFTWGSAETIYTIMTACRFILGVGVGGKYPLAATMRNEGAKKEQHASTGEWSHRQYEKQWICKYDETTS